MKKQHYITEEIQIITLENLEGSLSNAIKILENFNQQYDEYLELSLKFLSNYDYQDLILCGRRNETLREKQKRLTKSQRVKQDKKQQKEKKLKKDMELYQQLKKQFGE